MRVFLAIEFSNEIKRYLYDIQNIIKEYSTSGNFTSEGNFHLTLKFIGEIKDNELNKLKKAVDSIGDRQESFQIRFKELGQFPRGNKKIVWVGLESNETLSELYSKLEEELAKEGYPKEERSFTPHITLGREIRLEEDFENVVNKVKIGNVEMHVNKISIMESTRINGKLTYVPVYVKKFNL